MDPPQRAHGAGLAVRLASLVYEGFLLVPVLFISAWLFLAVTHDVRRQPMHLLFQLWLFAVVGAYFCYCWVKSGQTLAMKTWRLRLEGPDGLRPSPGRAVVRYVVAALGLFLGGAGFLWAVVDRERLFLHDRIARTRIVKLAPAAAASAAPAGKAD